MLLHLKALGGRRVVKEHTKKVPVCLLHLKDFGCAVELSKMDPRMIRLCADRVLASTRGSRNNDGVKVLGFNDLLLTIYTVID